MEQLITSTVSFSRAKLKKKVKTQLAIQNELLRDLSGSSSYQGDTQLGDIFGKSFPGVGETSGLLLFSDWPTDRC